MAQVTPVSFYDQALPLKEIFIQKLTRVIDPELGVDLLNLGLIYSVSLDAQGHCTLVMTLTSPGCPLYGQIEYDIRYVLSEIEAIESLDIQLTFDPPWTIHKMSRYARIALGVRP